ncbi:MAG: MBL fold metallo-hydrolase [Lachnospiraceae bacterium]|nr:MBL fold metallo-hydrolase [Candidatus Equihabitans merdae]
MDKIRILGTAYSDARECYNTCFVISDEEGNNLLVDGGGGVQILHQLKHSGFVVSDMRNIFVTHQHIDHLFGIIWLIRILCQDYAKGLIEGDINIYGHDEVIPTIREMALKLLPGKHNKFVDSRIHLNVVHDAETLNIGGHEMTFFDIRSTKIRQFGFTYKMTDGRKLTCLGDEPFYEWESQYVEGCSWLLHEAFCLKKDVDIFLPYEKHHSTATDAAMNAEKFKVPNLIIYHTEDTSPEDHRQRYTDEASQYYTGNLYVPDDMDLIELD